MYKLSHKFERDLSDKLKCLFDDSNISIFPTLKIHNNICGNAMNQIRNNREQIDVYQWFEEIWIYGKMIFSEIKIDPKDKKNSDYIDELKDKYILDGKSFYGISLSFSFFYGEISEEKKQLFRIERDSYDDHPQPHWHFYDYDGKEIDNVNSFESELEKIDDSFEKFLHKPVSINKLHFPVRGSWYDKGNDVHYIHDLSKLVDWTYGALESIKKQLQCMIKRS